MKAKFLVVVNFNDVDSHVNIHIPDDAFSFLGIVKTSIGHAIPTLNLNSSNEVFGENAPLRLKIDAYSGEVFKISFE